MTDSVLFVTGRLAEQRLRKILSSLKLPFEYVVWSAGGKVAALITESILMNRLPRPLVYTKVILPGRCRADLGRLRSEFGVVFERGPDELADLPAYFWKQGSPPDLTRHELRIFAEIVDASELSPDSLLVRARKLKMMGADVIDLGCLPDSNFSHLEEAVVVLRADGHCVSVDSADVGELSRAALAGADYVLSLDEHTIDVVKGPRPILVPAEHGDLESLIRAFHKARSLGVDPILDPILDPIHYGFTDSLHRYRELRMRLPEAEMLMGTGNLTELTEVDSVGVTAMLLGICSELRIANALTVQVSPHTRRTVQEHDMVRRVMFAARADHSLPKGLSTALLQIHDKIPFKLEEDDIASLASDVKDINYRIELAADGIHIFNRNGHWTGSSALDLFDRLEVEQDGAHAFYLGAELQKAEIALLLGKRYVQDEPLDWGVAADKASSDPNRSKDAGPTLRRKGKMRL